MLPSFDLHILGKIYYMMNGSNDKLFAKMETQNFCFWSFENLKLNRL